mmetsp:Transcript_18821/g.23949  ORF Transcript_18821/g.23949 Transcript_18821/m.23949 type:complete len:448 (-) Transcript_18821:332-1675(-)|eukprot:CAMPEP_0204872232 /NCGR_PEP_ID=MMETSP1348-20121228/37633_1 /ASSEMBLY_ACC=CAM_ASM_000700 /TAXON_ID=215587 /ORGANISM="Aplanochytrium stocchinoi, Strain GSBS06" /LENGTH=447 /DNA_ID=CAMNT_0052026973 /DNA_START=305 /DNA_END=1648 /DNA_ORIENTATION=+
MFDPESDSESEEEKSLSHTFWMKIKEGAQHVIEDVSANGIEKLPQSLIKNVLHALNHRSLVSGGVDNVHALLTIIRLINVLKDRLEVRNPAKLLVGAIAITRIQNREMNAKRDLYHKQRDKPAKTELSPKLLKRLVVFMNYSAGAYGTNWLLNQSDIIKSKREKQKIRDYEDAFIHMTGVRRSEIVKWTDTGVLYKPGYAVVTSRLHKKVIVAIRGTDSLQDALVDVVCEQQDYSFVCEQFGENSGKVHSGFLRSAHYINHEVKPLVKELLLDNPKFDLIITGHSLGAGVATILSLIWAGEKELNERNLHAYAFASPCSLCETLANSRLTRHYVTAVVNNDDVVCRLGISTLKDAQKAMVALAQHPSLSIEKQIEIYNEVEREGKDLKLFPGGQVWIFESEPHGLVPTQIDPCELDEIFLTRTFISNHLPHAYVHLLERAQDQAKND